MRSWSAFHSSSSLPGCRTRSSRPPRRPFVTLPPLSQRCQNSTNWMEAATRKDTTREAIAIRLDVSDHSTEVSACSAPWAHCKERRQLSSTTIRVAFSKSLARVFLRVRMSHPRPLELGQAVLYQLLRPQLGHR